MTHATAGEAVALPPAITTVEQNSQASPTGQRLQSLTDGSYRRLVQQLEATIGLLHSYRYEPSSAGSTELKIGYASEPSMDFKQADGRQILLVTHTRVRGDGAASLNKLNTYRGKKRQLVVYDESLIVSNTVSLSVNKLRGCCGAPVR